MHKYESLLPCSIGDVVYKYSTETGKVQPYVIDYTSIEPNQNEPYVVFHGTTVIDKVTIEGCDFVKGEIGESIFFECEEAEKAQRERL